MFSKNREKGAFKKILMTDDIIFFFLNNNLTCDTACGIKMTPYYKPGLGAAEIVPLRASQRAARCFLTIGLLGFRN